MYGAGSLVVALDRQITAGICSPILNCVGRTHLKLYVLGLGTTSSGVLTIEENAWDTLKDIDRATAWASVATVNATDATAGQVKVSALTVGAYGFLRIRISTVIGGGGTISAWLVAAP